MCWLSSYVSVGQTQSGSFLWPRRDADSDVTRQPCFYNLCSVSGSKLRTTGRSLSVLNNNTGRGLSFGRTPYLLCHYRWRTSSCTTRAIMCCVTLAAPPTSSRARRLKEWPPWRKRSKSLCPFSSGPGSAGPSYCFCCTNRIFHPTWTAGWCAGPAVHVASSCFLSGTLLYHIVPLRW